MCCRHEGEKQNFNCLCKITGKKCVLLTPDETECSEKNSGIIHYLKAIRTYDRVVDNPKYTN